MSAKIPPVFNQNSFKGTTNHPVLHFVGIRIYKHNFIDIESRKLKMTGRVLERIGLVVIDDTYIVQYLFL